MDANILKAVYEEVEAGNKVALVILTGSQKFSPAREGSIMAVKEDGEIFGTIGGGSLEYKLIEECKDAIKKGKDFEFNYDLSDKGALNMVCGGQTRGLVKIFYPNNKLIIFGAGHVSQKLARVAINTGFDVSVVDDREELKMAKDFQGIEEYICKDAENAVKDLDFHKDRTYIVICTRGHEHDDKALRALINKDYKYLGLIGSRKKIDRLYNQLKEEGYEEDLIKTINMPIGLDIDNGSVEEIAISIMSEILAIKNEKTEIKHNKLY